MKTTSFTFLTPFSPFHSRVCVCVCVCTCAHECAQSCPTFCNPMDCSLPGFSVHGIFQARILKSVTISYSSGSSWPRDQPTFLASPALAGGFFTIAPPGKPSILLWKPLWKRFSLNVRSIYFGCIRVSGKVCTQHFCYDYGFLNSVQVMDYWFMSFLL